MAFKIIKEWADEGHIASIYDLGTNFYYNGVGIEQDIVLARYYLNIAKEARLPRAIKKYSDYGFDKLNKEIKIIKDEKELYELVKENEYKEKGR